MADEKILSIQEKIQAQKDKIQEKVQKYSDLKKPEEKVKSDVFSKSMENTKDEIKNEIESKPEEKYIAPQVARDYDKNYSSRRYSSSPSASAILGGIMIMVVGFTTLTIGNYAIQAISSSLPTISDNNMNSAYVNNTLVVSNYVGEVLPLFGLAAIVLGFALILFTVRSDFDRGC